MPKAMNKSDKVVGSAVLMMVDARLRGNQPTHERRSVDRRAQQPALKPRR